MLFNGSQLQGHLTRLLHSILTAGSDEDERTWVWKSEEATVWFDPGTVVNIRIEQEDWQDRAPGARAVNGDVIVDSQPHVPYSLTVGRLGHSNYRVLTLPRLQLLKADLEA